MREMEARRWDPIPADQVDFFLDKIPGESALQQMIAWLRSHTVRLGRGKPYAVDQNGNVAPIERMAADLGWKAKWAQEVWRRGESLGLCRRDKQFPSRLYICGRVKRSTSTEKSNGCEDPSRCTTDSCFVLPTSLERQMADWEPEKKTTTVALLRRQHRWKEMVMRDGVAALRAITEQHDDRLLHDLGLEKRKQPKRREPPKTVRVELLASAESQADREPPEKRPHHETQATGGEAGGTSDAEAPIEVSQVARGQADPSSSRGNAVEAPRSATTTASPRLNEENAGIELVARAIARVCTPDAQLIRDLCVACRKVESTATYEEVAHFVLAKASVAMRMKSPGGFLLVAVTRCFEGEPFALYRHDARARAEAAQQEQQRRDAEIQQLKQGQQAILDDPNASAEDKQFARTYLETVAAPEER